MYMFTFSLQSFLVWGGILLWLLFIFAIDLMGKSWYSDLIYMYIGD